MLSLYAVIIYTKFFTKGFDFHADGNSNRISKGNLSCNLKGTLKTKIFVIMNYANDTENAERVTSELSLDYPGQFAMIHQRLETKEDVDMFYKDCVKYVTGGGGEDKITYPECRMH